MGEEDCICDYGGKARRKPLGRPRRMWIILKWSFDKQDGISHCCVPGFETGSVMWDFVVDKVARV
jgi:hypothetical protein